MKKDYPLLKSERVFLAPLTESDSPLLFKWINDRELVQLNAPYRPISDAQHQAWFESIRKRNDVSIFGIRKYNPDTLIGSCQLLNINSISRNAELQIRIGEASCRGQGLGHESLRLLLSFGFNDLNLARIYLHVFSSNLVACKVYKKLGFVCEGTLRKAVLINGEYEDVIVMGLLSEEYKNE